MTMIPATTFSGKRVAVFGMGLSGIASGHSLTAAGASVVAWDDGQAGREAASAAGISIGDLRDEDWSKIDALILAPGVPLTHPKPHWTVALATAHGVEIIGDIEIFCRERRAAGKRDRLIAITGTNGKSTTTALTHHLLRELGRDAVLGGNIGAAVLDLPGFADGRVYVVELSSFQLDLTPSLDADGAILLNITPDHLDRHGTIDDYAAVKAKVFHGLRDGAAAVIGADDVYCDRIAHNLLVSLRGYLGRISGAKPVRDGVYAMDARLVSATSGVPEREASLAGVPSLRGSHNGQNAAAALCLLHGGFGHDWDALAGALRTFPGLPHRMEEVRQIGRTLFINDSKATNADATARALASFDNIYWIAGGKPKDGGIESLHSYFPKIRKAYLIGEAAIAFSGSLTGQTATSTSRTLDVAVRDAASDAARDDASQAVVLLSPACASYDQFKNFEQRGDAFRALVRALPGDGIAREEAA